MEKQIIEALKMALFPPGFGEIGPQRGPELRFIQDVDQFELADAVDHFRRGHPQPGGPAGG